MLATSLLSRSLADITPHSFARAQNNRLIHALQPAPRVRFNGDAGADVSSKQRRKENEDDDSDEEGETVSAHRAGVNAITVDRFEGR